MLRSLGRALGSVEIYILLRDVVVSVVEMTIGDFVLVLFPMDVFRIVPAGAFFAADARQQYDLVFLLFARFVILEGIAAGNFFYAG